MILAFLYLQIGTAFYAARYCLSSHSWNPEHAMSRAAAPEMSAEVLRESKLESAIIEKGEISALLLGAAQRFYTAGI